MYSTGATITFIIHIFFDFVKLMYKFFEILMRIQKKIGFVKVCYNWLTYQSDIYIEDMVIKISLGATEKPCMNSSGMR